MVSAPPAPRQWGIFPLVSCFHFGEAFAAIYRAVRLWLKRNPCFTAAGSAGSSEKFTRAAGRVFACVTAGFAALRLILEATFCVKFLFTSGEYKFIATFLAY